MRRAALFVTALSFSFMGFGPGKPQIPSARPFTDAGRDGYVLTLWNSYDDAELSRIIARIKETGAAHLTIPYFGCQSTVHSHDVGACEVVDTNQAVREAKLALRMGMGVSLLPIVVTPKWEWRGDFDPDDVDAWFASYKAWLKGVVQIANDLHLAEFVVGSEFSKLYRYDGRWSQLLGEFRGLFSGPLVITVNWDSLDHAFWKDSDAIGISSYHPLSAADSPSQEDLDAGMSAIKDRLLAVSKKWDRPIYITETGFPSTRDAARHPWNARLQDGIDQELQARCFAAFSRAWHGERILVRATFWTTSDPGASDAAYGFETLGKPAEAVIRDFFGARHLTQATLFAL